MDIDQEDGGAPALQQPTASRSQQPTASRSARATVDLIAKRLAELKSPTKESAGDAAWRLHQCKPSCACAHAFDEEVRSSGLLALKGPESDAVGPEPEDSSRLSNALVPYSHQSQQSSAPSLPIVPEPVHEALKAPSDVSLLGHGAVVLKQTGITLSRNEFRAICEKQRNTRNFWKTGFIFPGQEHLPAADRNIFDRESLIRTKQFVCYGLMGCPYGDCLHQLETIDISAGRTRLANTVATKQTSKSAAGKTKETILREHLTSELRTVYDRSLGKFAFISFTVSPFLSVQMCVSSYLLLCGCSPNMAYSILSDIKSDAVCAADLGLAGRAVWAGPKSAKDEAIRYSQDFILVKEYVEQLKSDFEQSPAPGAARKEETAVAKESWRARHAAMVEYFKKSSAAYVPGNQAMLKRAWRYVDGLIALKQMTHAKCTICATADAKLWHLRGLTSEEAITERKLIEAVLKEHTGIHLGARRIMDNHAFLAVTNRRAVWCILIDAATCRNFQLPKFGFRTPKSFGTRPFWGYKLMAAYAHGFGFYPYLIHNSQKMGANLLWTVAWITLCKIRKQQGCYADVLFLVLDNTSSENKNEVMLAMAAWLVASGRFKQVRVFFLHVGHTHIIIDQIFGVVTVGLRRQELLLPEDLIANIETTLAANPKYMAQPLQELHHLWDFAGWVKSEMGPCNVGRICQAEKVSDAEGAYSGMRDFIFNTDAENLVRLQYREQHDHPLLPANSTGCKVITKLPAQPPKRQNVKAFDTWGTIGSATLQGTISLVLRHARSSPTEERRNEVKRKWDEHISNVPSDICLLHPRFVIPFEDFDLQMLRLTHQPVNVAVNDSELEPKNVSLENFKAVHFALRTGPLPVDPVISSEQSEAAYKKLHEAWLATLVDGPTSDAMSGLALPGAMMLARPAGEGLALYKIENLGACQGSRTSSVDLRCCRWFHKPNQECGGFWGLFELEYDASSGARRQVKRVLRRPDVMVWNVKLVEAAKKSGMNGLKGRVLSIASLKELARRLPEEYPFPKNIPASHREEAERMGIRSANNARGRRDDPAVPQDSSDEGEDDGEFDFNIPPASARSRTTAARASKTSAAARASAIAAVEASGGEVGEEDEDEGDGEEDGHDTEDASSVSSESSQADSNEQSEVPSPVAAQEPFELKPRTLVFVDLNGTGGSNLQYPAALAFVDAVYEEDVSVFWFAEPTYEGKTFRKYPKVAATDTASNVCFPKFWKTLPPRAKKKGKKKTAPTRSETLELKKALWGPDAMRVKKEWILKLHVPAEVSSATSEEDIFLGERLSLKLSFIHAQLIPQCKRDDCVNYLVGRSAE